MLKKVLLAIAAIPVLYLLFVVGMRFTGPTQAQREALALLHAATPPVAGRDGSDAAWLLEYDVPAARRAEVADATRRYFDAMDPEGGQAASTKDPRGAFPKYPAAPDTGVCPGDELDCLAFVRANAAQVAAVLATHARTIAANLDLAANHDGIRLGIKPGLGAGVPSLGRHRGVVLTHFAQQFVAGAPVEAVDALCTDLAGWRRIGADSDFLLGYVFGSSFVRQDLQLLSEMVAELPPEQALPASCAAALAEVADKELDLCPAMRSEFALSEAVFRNLYKHPPPGEPPAWVIDTNNILGHAALTEGAFCKPDALQGARADRRASTFIAAPAVCSIPRKAADPLGCMLIELSSNGGLRGYLDRRTDQAAQLALMRTIVWLRQAKAPPAEWPARLAVRPASLGLRRAPRFDAAAGTLSIENFQTGRGERFSLRALSSNAPAQEQPGDESR
jgi:hypothetical protein